MRRVYYKKKEKINFRYFFGVVFCVFILMAGIYIADYSMNSLMNSNNSLNIVRLQIKESESLQLKLFNTNFTINTEVIKSILIYLWDFISAIFKKFNSIFF